MYNGNTPYETSGLVASVAAFPVAYAVGLTIMTITAYVRQQESPCAHSIE